MKKITSFILSLALICTVIFPAIKFVSSAASEEEIAQAVEAVKTAWNNVEGEKVQLNFTKFEINSGTYAIPGDENNKVTYTEQVPEDIAADEFGAGYYTVNITDPARYFRKDAFHFSVPSTASVKISDIAEISYWYRCETTVSDRAPTSLILLNPNGGNVGAKYVQTLPWDNSWHCNVIDFSQNLAWVDKNGASMSLTDIANNNFSTFAICPSYGNENTNVNIGGVALKLKPQIPDLDSMSELDILQAYYAADWSGCTNTEALAAAITNLCAAIGETKVQEQQAIVAVKKAYNADSAFTADNSVWELKTALKNADKLVAKNETAYKDLFNDVLGFYGAEKITKYDCTFDDKLDICDLVTAWAYTNSEKVDIFTYALKDATGVIPDGVCNTIRTDLLN